MLLPAPHHPAAPLASPSQCFFPPLIILLFEVNHFFLKAELWVPPINPLNTYRLTILFLFALPGIKVGRPRHAWLGAPGAACLAHCALRAARLRGTPVVCAQGRAIQLARPARRCHLAPGHRVLVCLLW